MKLKSDFITHRSGDQQMMVSINKDGFHGMVRSNKTAAEIIDILKEETTKEQIVAMMLKKYVVPEDVIKEDIELVIKNLRNIGALEE